MASSSNPTLQCKYDVFLSFRGEDTRNIFTCHLYAALHDQAIETFTDNELERGEEISPALLQAIEKSKISIIILSKNYASSSWCLDELLKILECKNTNGQLVVPVFYHVDPSDVRNQTGSFAEAFAKHELKGKIDKVHKWKEALTEVANLAGHPWQQDRPDSILLHNIIEDIMNKLYHTSCGDFNGYHTSSSDFNVGIDSRIKQIEPLLCIGKEIACIVVGIWGMGGIGKTTIARAILNRFSSQFDGCCFLENVREVSKQIGGVVSLQKELFGKILKDENIKRGTVNLESSFIFDRLGRKKVLIVLDDVDDSSQLESIIGRFDWFSKGSRIIITTRNQQVLKNGAKIFEAEKLNYHEALQLFSLEAFKQNYPTEDFMELSEMVVNYAKGIPLALKVLGSFLFCRSKREWKSALDRLKETPDMKIQKVLRISYDGLHPKEKDIFCDIACFFKGQNKYRVMKILDGCGLSADIGISVLVEKSLITISNNNILCMHDLLQEMGWEIVREVSEEPGERSRLWNHEDVCHVLTKKTGTKAVKGIFLDLSKIREVYLSSKAFKKMYNLRLLKFYYPPCLEFHPPFLEDSKRSNKLHFHEELVSLSDNLRYLHWERYPFISLPRNFHTENLVELRLSVSKVKYLWEGTQPLFNLRKIDLSDCKDLIKMPDLSKAPNLKDMILCGCESLLEVHSSIQYLNKLWFLNLGRCKKLTSLPSITNLKSLRRFFLNDCSNLKEFLEISRNIEKLDDIEVLNLSRIPMEDFPSSIKKYLFGISTQCLFALRLDECSLLKIPNSLCNLSSLRDLSLRGNNFVSIPVSIKHLSQLEWLDLSDCKRLQFLPELPSSLTNIFLDDCISLQTISISSSIFRVTGAEDHSMAFIYLNCFKLDQNSRNKIEAHAQLKIQLFSTTYPKEKIIYLEYAPFEFVCPGSEIPDWFSYRSRGSLVTAKLPQRWGNSKFLGFALCAVVALEDGYNAGSYGVDFKMKSYNGKYERLSNYKIYHRFDSEHVVLWYESCSIHREFDKDNWFRHYCYNKASFQFDAKHCTVKKCGIHLLYTEDEGESGSASGSERINMIRSRSPNENFGAVDEGLLEPMAEEGSNDHSVCCDDDELNGTEEEPHPKRNSRVIRLTRRFMRWWRMDDEGGEGKKGIVGVGKGDCGNCGNS